MRLPNFIFFHNPRYQVFVVCDEEMFAWLRNNLWEFRILGIPMSRNSLVTGLSFRNQEYYTYFMLRFSDATFVTRDRAMDIWRYSNCIACDSLDVHDIIVDDTFQYGADGDKDAKMITVTIPVRTCPDCDEQYTDYRAARIRDRATFWLRFPGMFRPRALAYRAKRAWRDFRRPRGDLNDLFGK